MTTATLGLITEHALESLKHAERMTPHGEKLEAIVAFGLRVFSAFAAWYLRRCSNQLAPHVGNLRVGALAIRQIGLEDSELLDPNMAVRDKLESIKNGAREIIKSVDKIAVAAGKSQSDSKAKLGFEARRFGGVVRELFEVSNQLQWEIAEHDASYSGRLEGFVASNKKELEGVMDRMMSGR